MTPIEKAAAIMQRHGLVAMPALKEEIARAIEDAAASENEACARLCEWLPDGSGHFGNCAAAIRQRRQP